MIAVAGNQQNQLFDVCLYPTIQIEYKTVSWPICSQIGLQCSQPDLLNLTQGLILSNFSLSTAFLIKYAFQSVSLLAGFVRWDPRIKIKTSVCNAYCACFNLLKSAWFAQSESFLPFTHFWCYLICVCLDSNCFLQLCFRSVSLPADLLNRNLCKKKEWRSRVSHLQKALQQWWRKWRWQRWHLYWW